MLTTIDFPKVGTVTYRVTVWEWPEDAEGPQEVPQDRSEYRSGLLAIAAATEAVRGKWGRYATVHEGEWVADVFDDEEWGHVHNAEWSDDGHPMWNLCDTVDGVEVDRRD